VFNKHQGKEDKDGKEGLAKPTNRGMLTFEEGWSEVLSDCKQTLQDIGIPVQYKEQTAHFENQFRFVLR
jgi:hypothetical protein